MRFITLAQRVFLLKSGILMHVVHTCIILVRFSLNYLKKVYLEMAKTFLLETRLRRPVLRSSGPPEFVLKLF